MKKREKDSQGTNHKGEKGIGTTNIRHVDKIREKTQSSPRRTVYNFRIPHHGKEVEATESLWRNGHEAVSYIDSHISLANHKAVLSQSPSSALHLSLQTTCHITHHTAPSPLIAQFTPPFIPDPLTHPLSTDNRPPKHLHRPLPRRLLRRPQLRRQKRRQTHLLFQQRGLVQ